MIILTIILALLAVAGWVLFFLQRRQSQIYWRSYRNLSQEIPELRQQANFLIKRAESAGLMFWIVAFVALALFIVGWNQANKLDKLKAA
jgi:hypothetical protein